LKHLEGNTAPSLGAVLLDDCPFPKLIERKRFYRWSDGPNEILRRIERWVIGLHRDDKPSCIPASLPRFQGRERELDELWSALVDDSSTVVLWNPHPRSGKSVLAQEFARLSNGHFRDIVWQACGHRSPVSIAGDLRAFLPHHRQLLVLDDLTHDVPAVACEQGRASILITTRRKDLNLPPHARMIEIEGFNSDPPAEIPSDPNELVLLEAMSACHPALIPFQLARRIASQGEPDAGAIADRMAARRWIDPLDAGGSYFRLVYDRISSDVICSRHSQAVHKVFVDWRKQPDLCRTLLGEVESAFDWTLVSDWSLAVRLAAHAFAFLRSEERLPEAVQLYSRLRDAALERGDAETAKNCSAELSWILDERGGTRSLYVSTDQLGFEFA
jgi:hypothetical protein